MKAKTKKRQPVCTYHYKLAIPIDERMQAALLRYKARTKVPMAAIVRDAIEAHLSALGALR